jgi:dTDP-4-dehydrorhamnose reductase
MRIVVTGISGQVGGALVRHLQGIGTLVAADRAILDLSRPQSLADILDRLKPDIIINSAAYTAVDKAEDEPELAMVVNSKSPGVMARWAAQNGVPLIHFSTDYVFSGAGERPWSEEDIPQPLNVYGATKLSGEHEIRSAGGCFLIVRTSWVYGATGTNFMRTIARLAQQRTELRIVADQVGAPTSAALIANAARGIVTSSSDSLRSRIAKADGVVHLAASGEASWHAFASAIVDGLKSRRVPLAVARIIPVASTEFPAKAKRPRNSRLNLERVQRLFGITTPHWQVALDPELDKLAPTLT